MANVEIPLGTRVRNYCFTINNYNDNSLDLLKACQHSRYIIAGKEIAPTTGTPHLQGYVQFGKQMYFRQVKKLLPTANFRLCDGDAQSNIKYCSKDGDYEEIGTPKKQGKRNDIHTVTQELREGYSMREVALEHPEAYVKFHRGFEKFQSIILEPRSEPPEVTVLYGRTGTGKSRQARELTSDPYVWGPEQGKWFDGYEGQTDVIMEEFRGQLPFGFMLRLLDRYDCKVEKKGSMIEFVATKIIITSPIHPKEWYQAFEHEDDKVDQLLRRITAIKELK